METIVLLKDARTLATPETTFFEPFGGSSGRSGGRRAFGGGFRGFLFLRSGLFFGHVIKRLGGGGGFFGFGDTHGLARALAGAGVGARALAADREAATMANAAIAI